MRTRWRSWSLVRKITFYCVLTLVLPVIALSAIYIGQMNRAIHEGQRKAQEDYLGAVADNINEKAIIIEESALFLSNLPILSDYMRRDFQYTGARVLEAIDIVYPAVELTRDMHRDVVESITIYTKNSTQPEMGRIFQRFGAISDEQILEFAASKLPARWLFFRPDPADRYLYPRPDEPPLVHLYARKLYAQTGAVLGLIVVSTREEQLFSARAQTAERSFGVCYEPGLPGQDADMVYRAIMRLGISIHTPVDATRPQSLAAGNIASVAAAAAAGLFFMALLIRSLVANVFRRVRLSVDAMAQVASGRFTARVTDDRQDEITPLIAQFNRLLSYLENTVAELIAKERQKRDAQLVALQYQINPHFIYNSLYIVQLAVEKQGLFDVANAISWFASILHYNVAGSMFATFQQEIEHIHTYLKFINTFREQAITLQVSLPDELRRKLFLRFIFQPIIENAIKYGGRQVSLIAIAVDHRGDQFLVDVWNDGEPIDDEALAHVNLSLRAPEGEPSNDKGVGLRNIARRLHLFYQSQAGVYMTNGARTGVHIYFCDREVAAHEHTLADRG